MKTRNTKQKARCRIHPPYKKYVDRFVMSYTEGKHRGGAMTPRRFNND